MAQPKVERRLAAILSMDVVGYSRLMEANEAATLAGLRAHRAEAIEPAIAEHRGRVVKLMGDGVLVEFQSAVEAVQCAVEVQRAMACRNAEVAAEQRIAFRIGINLGDVVVDGDDIYGDGVNVAARLEGLAAPGAICIARNVFNQVRNKVELGFRHLGEQRVKNISEPITVYEVLLDRTSAGQVLEVTPTRDRARRPLVRVALALAALLLLGGGLGYWRFASGPDVASPERMAFALPDKPSIAVLPFDDLGDDPAQGFFADGVTEDLITDLSKVGGLFVIARNSTFTYKGRPVKAQQVAEDLGVRYVLEGSVRQVGDQVRINAQLIDATTGGHLWAERYDGSLTDIFGVQDRVTRAIVEALSIELSAGEARLVERGDSSNPEAYQAFLEGRQSYHKQTPEDYRRAIAQLERAIELDPDYGRAYAALAATYWQVWKRYWGPRLGLHRVHDARIEAESMLVRAMRQPTALAYQVRAAIRAQLGRHEEAIDDAERAISLDPNDADGYVALAGALSLAGRPEEALRQVEQAMRLNPYYPADYLYQLGLAQFGLGRLAEAAELLERAHALAPEDRWSARLLLSVYGLLGREGEAAELRDGAIASFLGMDPLTVRGTAYWYPFADREHADRFAEGLRRAGVPE